MLTSKFSRICFGALLATFIAGCTSSDTDGGGAAVEADSTAGQFAANGAAGSTIRINAPERIPTGGTAGFSVELRDPQGEPLPFVRVFCESEQGIAILEPSDGGVAFESTTADGTFSGVLGGVTRGSYLLECRGPQGFNLVAREEIVVVGDIPQGFDGFPGAAGGNLGGGLLVDTSDDPGNFLTISVAFADGGRDINSEARPNGPIDTTFDTDCAGDGGPPGDDDGPELEVFTVTDYIISVSNSSDERIEITSVRFDLTGVGPEAGIVRTTGPLSQLVVVPANSTGEFVGVLLENAPPLHSFVGSGDLVVEGTFDLRLTLSGVSEQGTRFSTSVNQTLTFSPINNCGAN